MKGIIKRVILLIFSGAFLSMGLLIVLFGAGAFDSWIINTFGADIIPQENYGVVIIGMILLFGSVILSIILFNILPIDAKSEPIKMLSRVEIQNKIFLIADQELFEKETVEWGNVDLNRIRKKSVRSFFYLTLHNVLYIEEETIDEVRTEELLTFDELASEFTEAEFKIGEMDDDRDKDQEKK